MGHAHRTMGYNIPFVTLPPLRLQEQKTTYPKGSLKWSSVQELRNKGAIEPAPLTPGFYRGVEADHRSVLPQCLRALPELHYGDASVNPQGPTQGQWLTSLDLKDASFHKGIDPADRRYLHFCHNGTLGSSQFCHSGCHR